MPSFRATHKQTGEVAEYSKPLPLPEHLTEGWRLEEVSDAERTTTIRAAMAPV